MIIPITAEINVTSTATRKDIRVPYTSLAKTSRPFSSLPSRFTREGRSSRCIRLCDSVRSFGMKTGALRATTISSPIMTNPIFPSRGITESAHLYTWIEETINHIRQSVGENVCQRDHQYAALNKTIISLVYTFVYQQSAESRPIEYLFSYYSAGQQDAELKTKNRHDRNQAVLQNVLVQDFIPTQTLCSRSANVIFVQFFQNAGPDHPGQYRGQRSAKRNSRQDQVVESASARNRQQSKLDREEKNHQRSQSEVRQRNAKQSDNRSEGIDPSSMMNSRSYPQRNRNNDCDSQGGKSQFE